MPKLATGGTQRADSPRVADDVATDLKGAGEATAVTARRGALDGFLAFPAPPQRRVLDPILAALVPAGVLGLLTLAWFASLPPGGPGSNWSALGQWCGLAAAVSALVYVVLGAQIPLMTDRFDPEDLAPWSEMASTTTLVLLVIHVITVAAGSAAIDATTTDEEFVDLLRTRPTLSWALIAGLVLLVASVASQPVVRQRLGHELKMIIPWLGVIAVVVALGHQVAMGASFIDSTFARLAWTWLNLFVVGLALWYRGLLPLWLKLSQPPNVPVVVLARGYGIHHGHRDV